MRRANLSKQLYGLFIFICVMCLLSVFSSAANAATLADLAGTWHWNAMVTGPGAPWWERMTVTVKSDGTFTGSGTQSTGNPESFTGAFKISSGGLQITGTSNSSVIPCQIDLGNTVLSCTETWAKKAGSSAGSTNLIIGVKQADSYSVEDGAGNWEANMLDGGPTNPSWMRITDDTQDSNGNWQGTYSDSVSNGDTIALSGQTAISSNGEVTCVSGCPDPNLTSYVDASKSVVVGTYGVSNTTPDAVLTVFTKMAPSYSMDDLAGVWQGNLLASGPGAPFWSRGTLTIKPDGTSTISASESDSSKTQTKTGQTFSISSDGLITMSGSNNISMVMNAGKTVMVETDTWTSGPPGTTEIGIFTKTASLPGAPTEVSATPGNAQAAVSFTQAATNGSAVTGYTVTSSPDATHPDGITGKGTKSPITVKGLTNGTPYTFAVTATNKIGTGPASNPASNSVTPATKPAPPIIGIITVGTGQATVNFTEKSDGGSPAIFTVTSNPKGGVDQNDGSASLSHLVTNLTSGKKYTFTVTATNAFGKSSSTSKSVTIE